MINIIAPSMRVILWLVAEKMKSSAAEPSSATKSYAAMIQNQIQAKLPAGKLPYIN